MNKIKVGEEERSYVGLPLEISLCEDDMWGGRSNFLASNETEKETPSLKDLKDCFVWMKRWVTKDNPEAGYVLDFESKTVYYNKPDALIRLKEKKFPKRRWGDYFQTFTQIDFSQNSFVE